MTFQRRGEARADPGPPRATDILGTHRQPLLGRSSRQSHVSSREQTGVLCKHGCSVCQLPLLENCPFTATLTVPAAREAEAGGRLEPGDADPGSRGDCPQKIKNEMRMRQRPGALSRLPRRQARGCRLELRLTVQPWSPADTGCLPPGLAWGSESSPSCRHCSLPSRREGEEYASLQDGSLLSPVWPCLVLETQEAEGKVVNPAQTQTWP